MSINSLLSDTKSKSWCDLFVNSITCYDNLVTNKINGLQVNNQGQLTQFEGYNLEEDKNVVSNREIRFVANVFSGESR